MCLEEMLCCDIREGALFYGQTRRRVPVSLSDTLRERVRERSFGSRYAVSHTRIELCTLGYRAGVIGAAMLARE